MKKLSLLLVVCMMILSLAGCKKETNTSTETSVSTSVSEDNNLTSNETTPDASVDTNEGEPSEGSEDTLGKQLSAKFLEEIEKTTNLEEIANSFVGMTEFMGMVMPIEEEGYLMGFSSDITGFKACVQYAPMIGSIPFVSYLFEVEDAESFKDTLLANADPRWNICTSATETECVTSGNYVFFAMCP